MVSITQQAFNEHLDEFQCLVLENIVPTKGLRLLILNSYVRAAGVQKHRFLYVRCCLNENTYFDFTVSFDTFFGVPVLHFKAYDVSKGHIREIFDVFDLKFMGPSTYTIETHHLLNNPWFYVHPCETASTMNDFMTAHEEIKDSIILAVVTGALSKGSFSGAVLPTETFSERDSTLHYLCIWFGVYITAVIPRLSFRPNMAIITKSCI